MKNKVVIITGASSGIGLACAKEFANCGAKVVLAARRKDKLKEIENEILNNGAEVLSVKTDVSCEEDCKHLISETINKFGTIDILINNAGISMRALFIDTNLDVLKTLMNTNFWGTVYCTKYALPYLLKSKGSLIGISSISGLKAMPGRVGYSISKFALHGFLETLRIEYLKTGLHVLTVVPGFTASNIRRTALGADGSMQEESPRDESKMMPAEKVAKRILKAVKKRKRIIVLTLLAKSIVLVNKISPRFVDIMFYKQLAKEPDSPFK